MKNKKVYKTTLRLHDINHLFDDPNISPFSDYYQPYSFKTGMDYIVDELYNHPSAEEIELTVLLPAEQITRDLEAKKRQQKRVAFRASCPLPRSFLRCICIRAAIFFGLLLLRHVSLKRNIPQNLSRWTGASILSAWPSRRSMTLPTFTAISGDRTIIILSRRSILKALLLRERNWRPFLLMRLQKHCR